MVNGILVIALLSPSVVKSLMLSDYGSSWDIWGNELHQDLSKYYSRKILQHGPTPAGVDWNGASAQETRFRQVAKILTPVEPVTVADVGCGYGAFLDYLRVNFPERSFRYRGYDISREMVEVAMEIHPDEPESTFTLIDSVSEIEKTDFSIASGIFSVKLDAPSDYWRSYIEETLLLIADRSRIGFAFNLLTSHCDRHLMTDRLYYADPSSFLNFCLRSFSSKVALFHDYGLHEFTILVEL